jgi:hypothetical protein
MAEGNNKVTTAGYRQYGLRDVIRLVTASGTVDARSLRFDVAAPK